MSVCHSERERDLLHRVPASFQTWRSCSCRLDSLQLRASSSKDPHPAAQSRPARRSCARAPPGCPPPRPSAARPRLQTCQAGSGRPGQQPAPLCTFCIKGSVRSRTFTCVCNQDNEICAPINRPEVDATGAAISGWLCRARPQEHRLGRHQPGSSQRKRPSTSSGRGAQP